MVKWIVGGLVLIWLLGQLLKIIGWVSGLISSLFYILLIIALIIFVIDLLGGRRKV